MTHAEVLVQDILDYVKENYPQGVVDKLEERSGEMANLINATLPWVVIPSAGLTMEAREGFIEAFAETFCP